MLTHIPSHTFFFFNATATTEIYTLSLHDALPILQVLYEIFQKARKDGLVGLEAHIEDPSKSDVFTKFPTFLGNFVKTSDRKSTRLNSSHGYISYAVFCLKKKKKKKMNTITT